jgi:anti-sigma factor RsiW
MQSDGPSREPIEALPDALLWHRSRTTDTSIDEADRFLEMAAFADDLLDPDDRDRVAEWLEQDPAAAADIAAARTLAGTAGQIEPAPETLLARALPLVAPAEPRADNVVAFTHGRRWGTAFHETARWASLAAAVVVASWLGFNLGMDTSLSLGASVRNSDDGALNELFDPSTSLIRDLTEGAQT